jgi:hypothetical protein
MNNQDLERMARLPKQYAENVLLLINNEVFTFVFISGTQETSFTLTPKHAKKFAQSLLHNVQDFEAKHGEIEANWQPGIESPFSISELNQSKDKKDLIGGQDGKL